MSGKLLLQAGVTLALLGFSLLLLAGLCVSADGPAGRMPTVEELIEQLGSLRFEERQEATRQLSNHEAAVPALRRALRSPDPEVAKRAAGILAELDRRDAQRNQAKLATLAKTGAVDRLIERVVHLGEASDDDAGWLAVVALANQLLDLEATKFAKTKIEVDEGVVFPKLVDVGKSSRFARPPLIDLAKYRHTIQPQKVTTRQANLEEGGKYLIRSEEVAGRYGFTESLIVSSGPVRVKKGRFISSIVFSGQSVEAEFIGGSVIVCDGDLTAQGLLANCLVVARGKVTCERLGIENCVVISGEKVYDPKQDRRNSVVVEDEPNPFGLIRWFETASVGVVVEKAEGGVKVKEAAEGKAFAKAGLKAGDLIAHADDKLVGSPDDFRRLLRKHLATEEELTLEVRRDGRKIKLVVPVKE